MKTKTNKRKKAPNGAFPSNREKREALRELSNIAKAMQKSGSHNEFTVNEILINEFYTDALNQEFHTLYDWNKKGCRVNKGATAFLIWGTPRPLKQTDKKPEDMTDEEKEKFFPLAYLFSNAQVTAR
jgi:hypothetical protein